jgi:hypothetical protein
MELLFHGPIERSTGGQHGYDSMLALQKANESRHGRNGRTEFRCLHCDLVDPIKTDAVKWAQSPLAARD